MPEGNSIEVSIESNEDFEEVRRAFKRVERHASKMAREIGFIETTLAKYGIGISIAIDAGTIHQERDTTTEETPSP